MENQCMILGEAYSFKDAKLNIAGLEMFSVTSIKGTVTQTKTNNYGAGSKPVSRGRGVKEFECSFDLSLKDTQRLQLLSPSGLLVDLPISNAIVSLDNGIDKTEFVFSFFEFNDDGIEIAKDDTEARRTYTGICADIIKTKL